MKALIFDMDGLLLDTEPLHMKAWQTALSKYGVKFNEENYSKYVGIGDSKFAELFIEMKKIKESKESLIEKKIKLYHGLLKNVKIFKGCLELMDFLEKNRIPFGLASSSSKDDVRIALKFAKLESKFNFILAREDVEHIKPAPDLYLKALKFTKTNPKDTLVLEDSDSGILAAKAAGCFCVGIKHTFFAGRTFSLADIVFDSVYMALPKIKAMF